MRAGPKAEVHVSRTDKTRPYWVKMADSPRNYREVHQHATRPVIDADGEYVYEETDEISKYTGKPVRRIKLVPFTECDLPESPYAEDTRPGKWMRCHYDYSWSFINSGQARCGCPMCAEQDWKRSERRRERHDGRRQARDWWREYES